MPPSDVTPGRTLNGHGSPKFLREAKEQIARIERQIKTIKDNPENRKRTLAKDVQEACAWLEEEAYRASKLKSKAGREKAARHLADAKAPPREPEKLHARCAPAIARRRSREPDAPQRGIRGSTAIPRLIDFPGAHGARRVNQRNQMQTESSTHESNPLAGLDEQSQIVLFRAINDYCQQPDEDGQLVEGSFAEWLEVLRAEERGGHPVTAESTRKAILQKIQALRANAASYTVTLRPDVAASLRTPRRSCAALRCRCSWNCASSSKRSLNGHAR